MLEIVQRLKTLDTIFADTVARGWRPRSPAFGHELAALEVSTARGTCLEPLLVAGDEVFSDPHTPAQPGDLVLFALSARGAEAQGHTKFGPSRPGDLWVKLYTEYHGFPMLLENTGHAAVATRLCCEHPDDVPVLHPVRNVRRGGRLLFGPDLHSAELGLNAATTVAVSSGLSATLGHHGSGGVDTIGSVTVGPYTTAATIVLTFNGQWSWNANGSANYSPNFGYNLATANTGLGTLNSIEVYENYTALPPQNPMGVCSIEVETALPANTTQTYYAVGAALPSGGTVSFCSISDGMLKAEAIYR